MGGRALQVEDSTYKGPEVTGSLVHRKKGEKASVVFGAEPEAENG